MPFIKDEYFSVYTDKTIFNEIYKYFDKFSNLPSKEALIIELSDRNDLTEEQFGSTTELLNGAEVTQQKENREDLSWLLERSEKFCQDKALYNAITDSIGIFDESSKSEISKDAIPTILSDALSVTFDTHIGHDYIDNSMERFEFYRKKRGKDSFRFGILQQDYGGRITKKNV